MKVSNQPPQPPIRKSETSVEKPKLTGDEKFRVGSEKVSADVLESIRTRYDAADLKDPVKAESAVRESLAALLGKQRIAGGLPDQEREKLLDFLQSDPIVRGRIDSLLKKVLS